VGKSAIRCCAEFYEYNSIYGSLGIFEDMLRRAMQDGAMYIYSIKETCENSRKSCQVPRHRSSLRCRKRPTAAVGFFEADQPGYMLFGLIPRMPSCASLFTLTTATRMALVPPSGFVCMLSLTVVPQHRRSFVFEVLVKELSIRSIIIRWCNPFPWHDAWESYAYASGAVQP
jgi:hypothetical protein